MGSKNQEKKFDFFLLRRLLKLVWPYRFLFISSLILAVVLAVFVPVTPYLIQIAVDRACGRAVHIPGWVSIFLPRGALSDLQRFIISIACFQICFILLDSCLRFCFSFMTSWLGQFVIRDLRASVFSKVLSLRLSVFDKTPIGTLTTRTINDIESINDIFSDGLIPILSDMLSILFTLLTMFSIDWKLSLIALIPFPFFMFATYFFKESVRKNFIRVRNAVASLNAFVQEHLTGMAVVQSFVAENQEYKKFRKINGEHRQANVRAIFAYSIFFPILEIVLATCMALIIWYVANQAIVTPDNKFNFSGKIVAFILYMNLIFRPLRVIADKFNILQMGMIAAERVFRVLDWDDEDKDDGHYLPAGRINGRIVFDHVSFYYTAGTYVLHDINFEVNPGETLALVGHTGSGKTSIISLINRLYPVVEGRILLDGVDIRDYRSDALRSGIGVVLQDVFLFSGSVLENITLRNPAISLERVRDAAEMIGMDDFIMSLPGGYEYNVMERGATLSLGQRQLISFIRTLLYDPSVLILDEATSSVDTESELLIQRAIELLTQNRTSIVIAHRLSTIRQATRILVLEKGKVRESGTHQELLDRGGYYAKLIEQQSKN